MKAYDKFLYYYFSLKKKRDISSIFFLSLIELINVLTISILIDIIANTNIYRIKHVRFLGILFFLLIILSNLFYLLRNKKFNKIFELYENVDLKLKNKGQLLVIIYIIISVVLFLTFGIVSAK